MFVPTRFDLETPSLGSEKKKCEQYIKKLGIPKRNLNVLIALYFIYLKMYLNMLEKMAFLNALTVIIYTII